MSPDLAVLTCFLLFVFLLILLYLLYIKRNGFRKAAVFQALVQLVIKINKSEAERKLHELVFFPIWFPGNEG